VAKIIQGVVSRIFVQVVGRSGETNITLKMEGDPEIYVGQSLEQGDEHQKILLTKPDDTVSFRFEKDFRNYFRSFENHTIEGELESDKL
jgi:hypothetical protein